MPAPNGLLALSEVRPRAAAVLAAVAPSDPAVLEGVVDSVEPPALVLSWDDPWLEPETLGPCIWRANLVVLAIAGRLEPGPGFDTLETLIPYVVNRLQADAYSWPVASSQAPRVFEIGGIQYLGARLVYGVRVSLEEV